MTASDCERLLAQTFDGWIDNVTRDLLGQYSDKVTTGEMSRQDALTKQAGVAFFMVSYVLLGGLVLINVVMAILVGSFRALSAGLLSACWVLVPRLSQWLSFWASSPASILL